MPKIHLDVCVDPQAHALAVRHIGNLSGFVNDSIYAYCSGNLSDDDRRKIPADTILAQELVALQKEHEATVKEYGDYKAAAEQRELELNAEVSLLQRKVEHLEGKLNHSRSAGLPMGRMEKIAELRARLKDPSLSEEQKAPIISEIARLVRGDPEAK